MGCVCSNQSRVSRTHHEDTLLLASQTYFNEDEIEVLRELFMKLSKDHLITKEEFQFILLNDTKRRSLSTDRIFGMLDMRKDGAIDFGEFVHSLNVFHPNSSQRDKAIFAFRLYDTRQTGFIEPEEVKEMIVDVVEESGLMLTDSIIDSIVSKTFEEADWKKDGKIDLEEWETFVAAHPLTIKNMTIPFLKDIPRIFPSFVRRLKSDIDG